MTEWPPFSSDVFLDTLKDVYVLPGRKAVVSCEGLTVRTLVTDRKALSGFFPFPFLLEPVSESVRAVPVKYVKDVVTGVVAADALGHLDRVVAPFVDWRGAGSFDDYLAGCKALPGMDSIQTVMRKHRRIEREFGPTVVRLVDDDPRLLETLLTWKAAQYEARRSVNRLAVKQNVDFFRELHRRGFFVATSFRAGDVLLGGKVGIRHGKRHLSRLTVYNPELAKFSPGSVMELETLRASHESGDEEFDFLMGRQPYKFTYATHMRLLSDIGQEPVVTRAVGAFRSRVGSAVHGRRGYNAYREGLRRATVLVRRAGRR